MVHRACFRRAQPGKCGPRKGPLGIDSRDDRARGHRQQQVEPCLESTVTGRSAHKSLAGSQSGSSGRETSFHSSLPHKLDHSGFGLSERRRVVDLEADRGPWKTGRQARRPRGERSKAEKETWKKRSCSGSSSATGGVKGLGSSFLGGSWTCQFDRCYHGSLGKSPRGSHPDSARGDLRQLHKSSDDNPRNGGCNGLFSEFSSAGDDASGSSPASFSFTFENWCMSLTRWVLASRTSFGHFLSKTLNICRDGPLAPPTALFPLPVPAKEPYAEGPGGSKSAKLQLAVDRALHVIVMALNFVYHSKSYAPLELLRRQPNEVQQKAIDRLRLFLKASNHGKRIEVAACGRKNLQLLTRLKELAVAAEQLGLSSSPYQEAPPSQQVCIDNSAYPQLRPFSNLVPERLKISGEGQWNAARYLDSEFYMAYQEPQVLELERPVFDRGIPNFNVDSPEAVFRLFERWDSLGLLHLHPVETITTEGSGRVKIFNAFKSEQWDRQIGDRRERNSWEARMPGPSGSLPVGPMIGRLAVPAGHGLLTCITDRSDYYHQMGTSLERSRTNIVWPPMKLSKFIELKAYQKYLLRAQAKQRPPDRMVHGDALDGLRPCKLPLDANTMVYGSFGAILQGDHLGVEYGISAHAGLLKASGLLQDEDRLQSHRLIRPSSCYQGLVIDDFFCIAPVPLEQLSQKQSSPSEAKKAFDQAKLAYLKDDLRGSDPKDVIDEPLATVVGAEIDSRTCNVKHGILPVGAPAHKRLALSWIAAKASGLSVTSDALHSSLLGGLVSAFCFRKCTMSILSELFKVIPPSELDAENPKMRTLSRKAAEELILAAVLLPVIASDVKLPFHDWVYSSDASSQKGAFCEARLPPQVAEPLWQSGDFKGGYTMLDPWEKQVLSEAFNQDEEDWERRALDGEDLLGRPDISKSRPLAQYYDFIEVCGGSGVLSEQMAELGYTVGPIIDLTYSGQYDLVNLRVLEWLLFLVQNRRVRAIALEPPCTTFSAAAYPSVRSYQQPRGYNQKCTKTWVGNRLAFACLLLLSAAALAEVLGLLETPRRSKMAWLDEWRRLLEIFENVEEVYTASCSFGSQFQKEFRFLLANMKGSSLCRPCTRDHSHVRIKGQLTKGSAVYCPGLARAMALLFSKHLEAQEKFFTKTKVSVDGLESPLVNDLLKKLQWRVSSVWKWTSRSHINVLEMTSAFQALKSAARKGGGRVPLILDSNVSVRAIAKGRSSSRALQPLLRKIMALSLAFGIMAAVLFGPTRLNLSDDPTRDEPLRAPLQQRLFFDDFSGAELFKLCELPKLRRWASNWISLLFGLCLKHSLSPSCFFRDDRRFQSPLPPPRSYHHALDFDSSLGFPGEGPFRFFVGRCPLVFVVTVAGICIAPSHAMIPRNFEDAKRAERRLEAPLKVGRAVLAVTKTNRDKLLEAFQIWLVNEG